jgi:hypothetical protein
MCAAVAPHLHSISGTVTSAEDTSSPDGRSVNTRTVVCTQVINPDVCVLGLRSVTHSRKSEPQTLQTYNLMIKITLLFCQWRYLRK